MSYSVNLKKEERYIGNDKGNISVVEKNQHVVRLKEWFQLLKYKKKTELR